MLVHISNLSPKTLTLPYNVDKLLPFILMYSVPFSRACSRCRKSIAISFLANRKLLFPRLIIKTTVFVVSSLSKSLYPKTATYRFFSMAIVAHLIRVSLTASELDGRSSKISHWMAVLLPLVLWVRVGRVYPPQSKQKPCDGVWSFPQCRHFSGVYVR